MATESCWHQVVAVGLLKDDAIIEQKPLDLSVACKDSNNIVITLSRSFWKTQSIVTGLCLLDNEGTIVAKRMFAKPYFLNSYQQLGWEIIDENWTNLKTIDLEEE